MRRFLILFWLLVLGLGLAGGGLLCRGLTFPVYTDPDAPGRLSIELDDQRADRFHEWFSRLRTYETPHKRLTDEGRGLIAASLGLAGAAALLSLYLRRCWARRQWFIAGLWFALWAFKVPFAIWYYGLRALRFDYPTWGDSIAIPIFEETIASAVGAVLSYLLLRALLGRRSLPDRLPLSKPRSRRDRIAAAILVLWLLFLGLCIVTAVPDGDEGMTFCCLLAGAILLIFLAATGAPADVSNDPVAGSFPATDSNSDGSP